MTYESIREWCQKFGQQYANQLQHKRHYVTRNVNLDKGLSNVKAYQLQAHNSLDSLKLIELPEPSVGENDVLVRIRANSMNYRELLILRGGYVRNKKIPVIPASDGVGEVVAVGNTVTAFQPGDRVAGTFFQDWESGAATENQMNTALGGGIDGTLAEYVVFPEHGLA